MQILIHEYNGVIRMELADFLYIFGCSIQRALKEMQFKNLIFSANSPDIKNNIIALCEYQKTNSTSHIPTFSIEQS